MMFYRMVADVDVRSMGVINDGILVVCASLYPQLEVVHDIILMIIIEN